MNADLFGLLNNASHLCFLNDSCICAESKCVMQDIGQICSLVSRHVTGILNEADIHMLQCFSCFSDSVLIGQLCLQQPIYKQGSEAYEEMCFDAILS